MLVQGRSVGERIGQGKVRVIASAANLEIFQPGEVLVTDKTEPDWEPTMKTAAAIVPNRGRRNCHAAIVSRELGLRFDRLQAFHKHLLFGHAQARHRQGQRKRGQQTFGDIGHDDPDSSCEEGDA